MCGFDSRGRNTSHSPWDCVKSERRYLKASVDTWMRDFDDEERDPIEVNMSNRVVVLICRLTRFIRAAALGKSDDDAAA